MNAFTVDIDSAANFVDLRRKSSGSAQAASGNQVNFKREGKDVIVDVAVNGRTTGMIFDPQGSGIQMSLKAAKALGLKVDEAEEAFRSPPKDHKEVSPDGYRPMSGRQLRSTFMSSA